MLFPVQYAILTVMTELGPEERDAPLSEWRFEVQAACYTILELWIAESRETLAVIHEMRDQLASASVYGSYQDQARAISVLSKMLQDGMAIIMQIVGQFDAPHAVELARQGQVGEKTSYDTELDQLDSAQREKLSLVLRHLVASAKKMLELRTGPVAAEVTSVTTVTNPG